MATFASTDFTTVPSSPTFTNHLVNSFPRHDTVKLSDNNFIQWRQHIRLITDGYKLTGFLDGTSPVPTRFVHLQDGTTVENPDALAHEQQDKLLTPWLLSTISSSILPCFTDATTANDVWITATRLFATVSGAKLSRIRHDLYSIRKGAMTVKEYVAKIQNTYALIDATGSRISESEKVEIILAGLPSEFDAVVTLASFSPEPLSFQRLFDVLLEFESRQSRSAQEVPFHANFVEATPSPMVDSTSGGRPPSRGHGFRPRVQCQICSRYGHLAQRCYYRYNKDYDGSSSMAPLSTVPSDWWRGSIAFVPPAANSGFSRFGDGTSYARGPSAGYQGRPTRPSTAAANGPFGGTNLPSPNANLIGLDGAGHALAPPPAPDVPWRTKPRARVLVPDDPCLGLPRILDVNASDFATTSGSNTRTTTYGFDSNENSYVPLPVGTSSWCPDSRATHHVCRDDTGLGESTPYSGTSCLLMGDGTPSTILSVRSSSFHTKTKILRLSNILCVPNIRKNLLSVSRFAKENNVFFEFHPSYYVVKDILTREVLLWGHTRDGLYYFSPVSSISSPSVLNTNLQTSGGGGDVFALWHYRLEHPRFTWVYLIRRKSQAVECFHQFQKMVQTQFGKCIKKFQSDWGGEYRAFTKVLNDLGILHRLSCPHTSEQNGVAERKHKHIVETGLTLLAHANLPMDYWGYAFCSAVHLINRLPTPVLKGKSPYQPCTFLGYSSQHKGYYCLKPDGTIIVSRHVMFDERRFLFSSSSLVSADPPNLVVSTSVPLVTTSDGVSTSVPLVTTSDGVSTSVPLVSTSDGGYFQSPNAQSTSVPVSPNTQSSFVPVSPHAQSPFVPVSPNAQDTSTTIEITQGDCSTQGPPSRLATLHVPIGNTHAMVTRSKARIFKPKVLTAEVRDSEPRTIEEALADSEWRCAVQAEFDALMNNSTWELTTLPSDRKCIGCKWLFRIKKNPDGTIARRKARLVAKGCSQVPGCDFKETFSPVVKPATIRTILTIAVSRGWQLQQVDVNNAFLNCDLADEVFMQQPPGYIQYGADGQTLVCRLKKALYGLRQALRAWFDKLKAFLVSVGFVMSKSDASLFVQVMPSSILYVLVYVDDIIITGSVPTYINSFVRQLNDAFSLKDMGELHYFLGIEVTRSSTNCLHLCQQKYIRDILERSSMSCAKSVPTPMVSSSLSKDDGDRLSDPTEYRSLAGALQYVVLTFPDIAYAVNRIFVRPSDRLSLVGYADANWGLDFDDRRSTTGYCEAKYRSLAAATSEVTWLVSLLKELHLQSIDKPIIWCDNSSAVTVAANLVLHSKFKHVELDLFFVREKVANGSLVVGEVPAYDQVADVLTKPISVTFFTRFRSVLQVLPVGKVGEC
ncbi:hypothetical protein CXB51_011188 [Gossypium anomalum]|uniref:Integrase catalytic domain-containing protein n=1 Tax=Gossypium anomalum TaxID=47600 RepID=A0A8J5YNY1_9ROSI|nr:hypothetical protein CXB51_011188 [Gossypium anomalum]